MATSSLHGSKPRSSNGAGRQSALSSQQTACGRIGGPHAGAPIDHQHAVLHLLDDQPVQLFLLLREFEAAACGDLFAGEPAREFTGKDRDDEEAAAGQSGLRQQVGHLAAVHVEPGLRQQQQASPRRSWQAPSAAASTRPPSGPAAPAAPRS